ncbi:uncharacterized protein EI97DRAFT_435378 [Westerdykella ornata]|uniref:t-SNARE coiled-coil homology domain-containing protein n=1 Tax=Westerdykella ornata TaxID=318751 RepID=A0A6A6JCY7_WESOR|nr:uncharacterized protein EI97DRAFT_435378 [Westerdykella ornata]KAF2274292.1 hypothetical protein EI97DRAFT_435378 [Westerdykella ornata]
MSNRFGRDSSSRPSHNSLFSSYPDSTASRNRSASPSKYAKKSPATYGFAAPSAASPSRSPAFGGTYSGSGSGGYGAGAGAGPAFSAYPGYASGAGNGYANGNGIGGSGPAPGFRTATPNSRGQYSAAVLEELESQNEEQVGVLVGKVRELKNLTHLIGDEIRSSSALADKMNDQFERSRARLRGTMTRMLRMAERTGVGWKVWLIFFACVVLLLWWVWLF